MVFKFKHRFWCKIFLSSTFCTYKWIFVLFYAPFLRNSNVDLMPFFYQRKTLLRDCCQIQTQISYKICISNTCNSYICNCSSIFAPLFWNLNIDLRQSFYFLNMLHSVVNFFSILYAITIKSNIDFDARFLFPEQGVQRRTITTKFCVVTCKILT